MSQQEYFKFSDGWLLASVGSGKLNLYHIISNGDMLNHAILRLDEINDGLSRLECEGFIEIVESKLEYTKKGNLFFKTHRKRFELCIPQMLRYCNALEKIPLQNTIIYKEYFSADEYDKVIKEYCPY